MFKTEGIVVFFLMLLLLNFEFLFSKPAFADENKEAQVVTRDIKATNPNCFMAEAVSRGITATIGVAIALFFAAKALNFIPLVGTIAALAAVVAALATFVAVTMMYPAFFACNWSFVRHPVMRFDENDADLRRTRAAEKNNGQASDVNDGNKSFTDNDDWDDFKNEKWFQKVEQGVDSLSLQAAGTKSSAGQYKECINPSSQYPSCANREYEHEDEYFRCLGGGDAEKGRQNEPTCPEKKYKIANGYYWPKNRVSSSNYIEFCYRLPLGLGLLPPVLLAYIIDTELIQGLDNMFKNQIDGMMIREGQYGGDSLKRAKAYIRGPIQCYTLRAGEKKDVYSINFKAVERSDKICVDAVKSAIINLFPQPEIGCHMRPSGPPGPMCEKSEPITDSSGRVVDYDNSKCFNCYIAPSCRGEVGAYVKSPFPVTSIIVSCIKESLNNLLQGTCVDGSKDEGFLESTQKKLKSAVNAVLVLSLILFAIKAALGGLQSPSEVYMLILKIGFIIYFTSGDGMQKYYNEVVKLSIGLSDIVLAAGGNSTVCNYESKDYNDKYQYIAPWDRLDCRMMFYFGSQLTGSTGGTVILFTLLSGGLLFAAILFNSQILICLVSIFAVLMIIFIVIWMVYLFILSLIALTILALISPLMIPMVLFQITKGFFDGWVRQIIAYSLYPVILFSFLSLIFSVFDSLYFEKLEFIRKPVKILDYERTTFVLKEENACKQDQHRNTLACILTGLNFFEKPLIFGINVTSFDPIADTEVIWTKLGMLALIGFLFYHFLESIGGIAAELAGDPRADLSAGGTLNPKAMMGKAINAAKKVTDYTSGGVASAIDSAISRTSPNTSDASDHAQGSDKSSDNSKGDGK